MLLIGPVMALIAGAVAFAVTYGVYRSAHRLGVVAEVNERSSHTRPTPSGGGVGIVAGGTIGAGVAVWAQGWPAALVAGLGVAMTLVGFLDDRKSLPVAIRLPAQLLLAGAMVATLPLDTLAAALGFPLPALAIAALGVIATVYWVNIFNFMDGIDGLAASEAAFIFVAGVTLALAGGADASAPMLWWFIAIAVATLAFLLLNWPPARIFMGDAGSTYLGFMIAFAAFASIAAGWSTLWQWLILTALFVTDATITLLRRLLRGEAIFRAHRLHGYQHLSRRWGDHRPVTLIAVALNVCWLLPLAWAAGSFAAWAPYIAAIAYLPLAVALLAVGAGRTEAKPA